MRAFYLAFVTLAAFFGSATAQFGSIGGQATSGPVGTSVGRGSSSSIDAASGVGDPILTGFNGRTFEFFGKVGSTYSLVSERNNQLSTRLKAARMWDHNGTYMEAFSLRYREHTVEIALADGDNLAVTVDGKLVSMLPGEVEVEHIFGLAEGELQLLWQLHKAKFGNAVDVSTELLQLLVWVTPAGTVDEGGVEQPAYLNFDLKLLSAPLDGQMQGVIGHTFMALGSDAPAEADDWAFHQEVAEYEMAGFGDAAHAHCLFQHAKAAARRLLGAPLKAPLKAAATGPKTRGVSFPVTAGGRGATRASLTHPRK